MPNTKHTERAGLAYTMDIEVRPVASSYEAGSWSRVEAVVTFRFGGRSVSIREERGAAAAGHRLAALALEAAPVEERWVTSTELVTSYADTSVTKVALELADGTPSEMERARDFLTGLVANARRPGGQGLLASTNKR
jgi:hypothetical protein